MRDYVTDLHEKSSLIKSSAGSIYPTTFRLTYL